LAVLAELYEVLSRPKFRPYVDEDDARAFITSLAGDAELIEVNVHIAACRDPKDDKFLELAISGQATHIVTGDADLLALNPFQGIAIMTPHETLEL
jgi:uncharacterized protein